MIRDLPISAIFAAVLLTAAPVGAAEMAPGCRAPSVNVAHAYKAAAMADADDAAPCVEGSPAAVRLELRRTTIAAALGALLTAYRISYRSSVALDETRDGAYAGSLPQVIARLLDGYDYMIRHDDAALDVVIFGKKGDHATAAPVTAEVGDNAARREAHVTRAR